VPLIVKHLPQVHIWLALLDQPTPQMKQLHGLLREDGH